MMSDHDDDCEKVQFDGGICTCDGPRYAAQDRAARRDDFQERAALRAMENYEGPALDY